MWKLNKFMEMHLPNNIYQMTLFPVLLVANSVMDTKDRFALLIQLPVYFKYLTAQYHLCVFY